eukprot:649190-Heterocapsa_arctica.AAC.1
MLIVGRSRVWKGLRGLVPELTSRFGFACLGIPRGLGCAPASGVQKNFHLEKVVVRELHVRGAIVHIPAVVGKCIPMHV